MNLNKPFVLAFQIAATTAKTEACISFPNPYLVRKMWVVTRIAGVAATHKIELQTIAAAVLSLVTPGTTVANTVMSGSAITDANQVRTAGEVLKLVTTNNESTGQYAVFIAGAQAE